MKNDSNEKQQARRGRVIDETIPGNCWGVDIEVSTVRCSHCCWIFIGISPALNQWLKNGLCGKPPSFVSIMDWSRDWRLLPTNLGSGTGYRGPQKRGIKRSRMPISLQLNNQNTFLSPFCQVLCWILYTQCVSRIVSFLKNNFWLITK